MTTTEHIKIPASHGRAVRLSQGQCITIYNTSGTQVVDTWALCSDDPDHFMSLSHTRVETGRISPVVGDVLVTNRREPILQFEHDSSTGIHDGLMAACDARRYANLGAIGHHRSCADNFHEALAALGTSAGDVPQPLNLFMNIPINADGTLTQGTPPAKPGDYVSLRALRDCILVMSACPQDRTPINGNRPTDAHFSVS